MKAQNRFCLIVQRVRLLSSMAVTTPRRSPRISVMSDASMATSVPVPMAMPTSAWARAGASLMPSPAMATLRPDSQGLLEVHQKDKIWFPFGNASDEHEVKIFFHNSTPLDLQIFSKVSKADLDLSQLNLKNLDLDLKVNATEVKFPLKPGQIDCKIKSNIGHLKLKVPKEAGLAIENSAKLSNSSFSNISLANSPEGFKTPDYQKAKSKINLILRGKIVQFEIETY